MRERLRRGRTLAAYPEQLRGAEHDVHTGGPAQEELLELLELLELFDLLEPARC